MAMNTTGTRGRPPHRAASPGRLRSGRQRTGKAPAKPAPPLSAPILSILVPVDFSSASRAALAVARELAHPLHARVTLLHVLEPMVLPGFVYPNIYVNERAAVANARRRARECLRAAALRPPASGDIVILGGQPEMEIARHARVGGFDLIVMATHGRSPLGQALLGSTAARVVRQAPCPVLLVPAVRMAALNPFQRKGEYCHDCH